MHRLITKVEFRDFLENLGTFWELTRDFYKIIVGNAALVACQTAAHSYFYF